MGHQRTSRAEQAAVQVVADDLHLAALDLWMVGHTRVLAPGLVNVITQTPVWSIRRRKAARVATEPRSSRTATSSAPTNQPVSQKWKPTFTPNSLVALFGSYAPHCSWAVTLFTVNVTVS